MKQYLQFSAIAPDTNFRMQIQKVYRTNESLMAIVSVVCNTWGGAAMTQIDTLPVPIELPDRATPLPVTYFILPTVTYDGLGGPNSMKVRIEDYDIPCEHHSWRAHDYNPERADSLISNWDDCMPELIKLSDSQLVDLFGGEWIGDASDTVRVNSINAIQIPNDAVQVFETPCAEDMPKCHELREMGRNREQDEAASLEQKPTTAAILVSAALSGAATAVIPEAIGDALHLLLGISEQNALYVKQSVSLLLVCLTGSWIGAGTALITSQGLKKIGVSESTARLAGNTAGFLAGNFGSITPTALAATAVSYTAGRVGFWAEKHSVKMIRPYLEMSSAYNGSEAQYKTSLHCLN